MLEPRTAPSGVRYYTSPLLNRAGVRHAFSTRLGGVSSAPFDALNLGNPSGCDAQDDATRINENYRRLSIAAGAPPDSRRYWAHQVHGADVLTVRDADGFACGQPADGLVTSHPDALLAIRVADCVPVLLATADGRHVAAAHAGWRGTVAGIVPNTLAALRDIAGDVADIHAAVGPCISGDAFEVGDEVAAHFARAFGGDAPIRRHDRTGKPHVDLRAAVRIQLLNAGVRADHIDMTDRCTVRDANEFYSHRRDRGVTGRMAAIIAPAH